MTKEQTFGWLLLALVSALNTVVVHQTMRSRPWAGIALAVAVPSFVGFALAQMGVQLLGGGS